MKKTPNAKYRLNDVKVLPGTISIYFTDTYRSIVTTATTTTTTTAEPHWCCGLFRPV